MHLLVLYVRDTCIWHYFFNLDSVCAYLNIYVLRIWTLDSISIDIALHSSSVLYAAVFWHRRTLCQTCMDFATTVWRAPCEYISLSDDYYLCNIKLYLWVSRLSFWFIALTFNISSNNVSSFYSLYMGALDHVRLIYRSILDLYRGPAWSHLGVWWSYAELPPVMCYSWTDAAAARFAESCPAATLA
jgi:hypothetical protein